MIAFACCVGPTDRFETIARPALQQIMAEGDCLLLDSGEDGICSAYNRLLQRARALPECEALVLLHDDVELKPRAREQILAGASRPNVGVVGVVGGKGLYGGQWVKARQTAGYAQDFYGYRSFGAAHASVDVVDGLLLVLTPAAFGTLDFDRVSLGAFHGYDTDYCLRVRSHGLDVLVTPVDYVHHDKGGVGDIAAFEDSQRVLSATWDEWIRPLRGVERLTIPGRVLVRQQVGRAQHRAFVAAKSIYRALRP